MENIQNQIHPVKYRKAVISVPPKLFNQVNWILQEKYQGKLTVAAKKDIERLKAGEPIDHIIGFTDFLGCKILVNEHVLIPRVETEFWTEQGIEELKTIGKPLRILDMFSGSGCIGIAIAKHIRNAHVTFSESEKEAIKQIKINCRVNKIPAKRYSIIQSDIFKQVAGTFDYIFANPPYIPTLQKNKIQPSVVDYEPHVALFGGRDGLDHVKVFLSDARKFLNPGGKIYMEFDSIQKVKIQALIKKLNYKSFEFKKDQYRRTRYVVIEY